MNNSNPKLSVIVPVYKVEQYIHRCIDSILNQTYKNLEVILVDDGSPDNCGKICDAYASKDSRVSVIHQQNMGLSMARNNGMKIASGDYICFVDSDDFIELKMYEHMVNVALTENLALVECSVNVNGEVFYEQNPKTLYIQDFDDVLERPVMMGFNSAWNKLYRKDLIANMSFKKGVIYEDFLFTSQIWSKIKKVGFIPMAYYHYSQEGESIMRSGYNLRKVEGFWGIHEAAKVFQKIPKKSKNKEKFRKIFLNILRFHYESLIENRALDPRNLHLKRMHKVFKENAKFTYTNPYYTLMYLLPVSLYIPFYRLNQSRIKIQKNFRGN
jgi:glycosyltransferase involved in cell wall biosynthesis